MGGSWFLARPRAIHRFHRRGLNNVCGDLGDNEGEIGLYVSKRSAISLTKEVISLGSAEWVARQDQYHSAMCKSRNLQRTKIESVTPNMKMSSRSFQSGWK